MTERIRVGEKDREIKGERKAERELEHEIKTEVMKVGEKEKEDGCGE